VEVEVVEPLTAETIKEVPLETVDEWNNRISTWRQRKEITKDETPTINHDINNNKYHLYKASGTIYDYKNLENNHIKTLGNDNPLLETTYGAEICRSPSPEEISWAKFGDWHRPAGLNSII
jgi:hypothetical protein